MLLWNWLRKRCGYHVCEEWTRWSTYEVSGVRPVVQGDYRRGIVPIDGSTTVAVATRWQERSCTICGRTQQRPLNFTHQNGLAKRLDPTAADD